MLFGVLRMPLPDNPADMGVMEWMQIKDRMRQAADELEKSKADLAAARELLQEARLWLTSFSTTGDEVVVRIDAFLEGDGDE